MPWPWAGWERSELAGSGGWGVGGSLNMLTSVLKIISLSRVTPAQPAFSQLSLFHRLTFSEENVSFSSLCNIWAQYVIPFEVRLQGLWLRPEFVSLGLLVFLNITTSPWVCGKRLQGTWLSKETSEMLCINTFCMYTVLFRSSSAGATI